MENIIFRERTNPGENYGISDMLKTYINPETNYSVDDLLPSVAYLHDGQIKDVMFDSFIILPSPNQLYNRRLQVEGSHRPMRQSEWANYIENVQYRDGYNVNALNEAVQKTADALNRSRYKAKLFLPIFYPTKATGECFGSYKGKNLNLLKQEDRFDAICWMIERQIEEFDKQQFSHLELAGFYWFTEYIDYEDHGDILLCMTNYIRTLGYLSVWSPYFRAGGFNRGGDCGFDLVTMQANYFPAIPDAPNAGPIGRLYEDSELGYEFGMGVELEMHTDDNIIGYRALKEYMLAGIQTGYINALHAYYIGAGPMDINALCNGAHYKRSAYDNLHAFLRKTLKESDVVLVEEVNE